MLITLSYPVLLLVGYWVVDRNGISQLCNRVGIGVWSRLTWWGSDCGNLSKGPGLSQGYRALVTQLVGAQGLTCHSLTPYVTQALLLTPECPSWICMGDLLSSSLLALNRWLLFPDSGHTGLGAVCNCSVWHCILAHSYTHVDLGNSAPTKERLHYTVNLQLNAPSTGFVFNSKQNPHKPNKKGQSLRGGKKQPQVKR